jgi:hypothetical protein
MNVLKPAALAATILAIASPCLAQPAVAASSNGSPLANDGPYAGTSQTDFYHPAERITQLRSEIQNGVLAGPKAHPALTELAAIDQDLQYRIARHKGDLRDWDRELINQKLDALVRQYPALRS